MPSNPETIPQRLLEKSFSVLNDYCNSFWTFIHENRDRKRRKQVRDVMAEIETKKLTSCGEVLVKLEEILATLGPNPTDDLVRKIAEIKAYRWELLTSTTWWTADTALTYAIQYNPDAVFGLLAEISYMLRPERTTILGGVEQLHTYTAFSIATMCDTQDTLPYLMQMLEPLNAKQCLFILNKRCFAQAKHALIYTAMYQRAYLYLYFDLITSKNDYALTRELLCGHGFDGNHFLMVLLMHHPQRVPWALDFIDTLDVTIRQEIFSANNRKQQSILDLASRLGTESLVYKRVIESVDRLAHATMPCSSSSLIRVVDTDEDSDDDYAKLAPSR